MEIITKEELAVRFNEIAERITKGEIFIYPTDTIYGIGCNAEHQKAVEKIRDIKGRPKAPFSVISPDDEWINKNCIVTEEAKKWINQLPGHYTLIFKCKEKKNIADSINPGIDTIGVRVPRHWFTRHIKEIGVPIVTTSANRVGKPFMTSLEDLDTEIKKHVSFIIYEGEKKGVPSKIVDLATGKVTERK